MEYKKISFRKKIQKSKTMAHFVSIEKPFIQMLGLAPGDLVKVTIEIIEPEKLLSRAAMEQLKKKGVVGLSSKEGGASVMVVKTGDKNGDKQ